MKARAGISWQLILADLALILFMVTAGALSRAINRADAAALPAAAGPSPEGPPLAIYREAPGAPPLARWLAAQPADPRQRLTIVAQYPPGGQAAALDRARARITALGAAGARARVVIEPGAQPLTATLAYDAAPALRTGSPRLARGLQSSGVTATR